VTYLLHDSSYIIAREVALGNTNTSITHRTHCNHCHHDHNSNKDWICPYQMVKLLIVAIHILLLGYAKGRREHKMEFHKQTLKVEEAKSRINQVLKEA
jgi:hypothetical protein